MKTIGIIVEYNPFHNGHLYQINKTKQMFPNSTIIVIMSGHFMQRGEPSIINKWEKTKIALKNKVDLVIELPFHFASQSADTFSKGAIEIAKHLKIDILMFGSESGDIIHLTKFAKIQLENKDYNKKIKEYIKEGMSYPNAVSKALKYTTNDTIEKSNDILGISYIREIIKQRAKIEPVCIKRTNDYYDINTKNKITSASSIRKTLRKSKKIKKQVPIETYKAIKKNNLHFLEDYFPYLKYKIMTEKDLSIYQTVDEGINNRIKNFIVESHSLNELIENIKTRRYTYNKIRRMLTHILCNYTKKEADKVKKITYIRVLGFTSKGKSYLNKIKKEISVPIITTYHKCLEQELEVTKVYASILNEKEKEKLINKEYQNNVIKEL